MKEDNVFVSRVRICRDISCWIVLYDVVQCVGIITLSVFEWDLREPVRAYLGTHVQKTHTYGHVAHKRTNLHGIKFVKKEYLFLRVHSVIFDFGKAVNMLP